MYYPPDIKNLRKSDNENYVSTRDTVESGVLDGKDYLIPLVLGADGEGARILDIARESPVFIGGNGGPNYTDILWNFIALTVLRKSPDDVKLALVDPLGVDLKFAENLPHTILYAHDPCEIIGLFTLLENEIIDREKMPGEHVPIVVLASGITRAYAHSPELYRQALTILTERGPCVNVFSIFTLGLTSSAFCKDFDIRRTVLPKKCIHEPYERDIIALVDETAYRNRKTIDKKLNEKYIAEIDAAKELFEKYHARKYEQSAYIIKHFHSALKLLAEYKKLSASLLQRKLMIRYSTATKIIDAMLTLSLIKKDEKFYILSADENCLLEIINSAGDKIYNDETVTGGRNENT